MKSLTCFSSRSRGTCCAVILESLAENCRGRTTAIICTRTNAPKYILESHRLHFGSICDQNGRNFEPCCRVTSQKKLSYRLQALSSLFFDVMPSILRIQLDGWFSRCRGQSSGKSASRQRASQERSTRKVTSAVQEMFKRVKPCSRERVLRLARCFKQSNLALPAGGLSNLIVRMGRSPAHVQACWGGI